ncbi:ArnT family glycosyltransferase [Actinocorallia longicatena]|uniref:4-amino-4-deoxy-L-arabinose transferase-like glycosyltransferase n=1 Tax=Actinocorallia longicatena TaxID=111803 RepID=A0ABP6QB95_9ACTN
MKRRADDPRWGRPALLGLLAVTAVLYIWGLGASGWANAFYSAAVQAGSASWKAMFFGSSDAAGAITVDKTPLALWPMDLAARVFGVNTWSILVPQALEGVAAVGVLFAAVRRSLEGSLGRPAATAGGLVAGAVLALTPAATLMFRFNNPDAALVLLLVLAAYAMVRALPGGSTRWLVLAGVFVGLGFLAKMMQAFLVLPVFAVAWLVFAPAGLGRRAGQVLLAGAAMVVSAGWWIAVVALVPASSRPYIGGSQNNSVLELALGYNGIGRLNGEETGGLGNLDQQAGIGRIFASELGGQVSWLVPAALILLVAGFAAARGEVRFGLTLWGGWLLVTGLVFSFMQGIFHAYYSVALAPAVGALIGLGSAVLWRHRYGSQVLATAAAVTAVWSWVLLGRSADFLPWLRWAVLIGGLGAALVLLAGVAARRVLVAGGVLALVTSLAGPAAYAVDTARTPHSGAIPTAGPGTGGGFGPGGGGGPGRMGGGFGGPPGTASGQNGGPPGGRNAGSGGGPGGGMGGGMGGLLNATTPSSVLTKTLQENADAYTWVAAAVRSNSAAGYQLATGKPVMAIGGFNGTDPAPGLEQFQEYVKSGRIHYFIGGASGGGMTASTGSDAAQKITEWVSENFSASTIGGTTVYDLSIGRQ